MTVICNNISPSILVESKTILEEFPICDFCLGRMYAKKLNLSSNKTLGKKIKNILSHRSEKPCFICKNLLDNLNPYVTQLKSESKNIDFSSFLIGAILKPSLMDRDDLIRSKFKMRGIESIKSQITTNLTKSFSRNSDKIIDHHNPDLTLLVNFRTDRCDLHTKSMYVFGRYVKNQRGLSQKQKPCSDCHGSGCIFCNNHGITNFDSVEGIISKFFYNMFECSLVKFTWIGGEDKDSLVGGNGRPFFAKILNPKKRNNKLQKTAIINPIMLSDLKKIKQLPFGPIKFQSKIKVTITTKNAIQSTQLKKLKQLSQKPLVIFDNNSKSITRKIYKINYKKKSPNEFYMTVYADGGIPIKKLVEGNSQEISPSISSILNTGCICNQFDFESVLLNDNN